MRTLLKDPIIYRSLLSGFINLLTCVGLAVYWEFEGRGIFSLVQLVYPGFLFGYVLSIDTKDSFRAWAFMLAVGFICMASSLLCLHSIFSDEGSMVGLLLAVTLPGIVLLFLYKYFINRHLFLSRALITFIPINFAIIAIPLIALYHRVDVDNQPIIIGVNVGISILLWQLGFSAVCHFNSKKKVSCARGAF